MCPRCRGRSAGIAQLRKAVSGETVNALWQLAQSGEFPMRRQCPACEKPMTEVPVCTTEGSKCLDVCIRCQFVWLDAGEFESLPEAPPPSQAEPELSPEAKERMALIRIKEIREQADAEQELPEESWKQILGAIGLPVEYESDHLSRMPWFTWLIAAAIALIAVLTFGDLSRSVQALGLIPADWTRLGGLTLLSSFFLHGGVLHLLGNLYFLIVFGDNVEDDLGKGRFILLLLAATLAGDVLHIVGDPRSDIPCVGASGGISGIITYYALRFPHARLGLMMRFGFIFRWAKFSAITLFGIWICLQIFGTWQQVSGFSHVSSLAHLGGAAVGFVFWLLGRHHQHQPA